MNDQTGQGLPLGPAPDLGLAGVDPETLVGGDLAGQHDEPVDLGPAEATGEGQVIGVTPVGHPEPGGQRGQAPVETVRAQVGQRG